MIECNSLSELEEFPQLYLIEDSRKIQLALHLKESGVELFKKNLTIQAFQKFSEALKLLILIDGRGGEDLTEEVKESKAQLQLILYNNMASCHVLRGNWDYAVDLSSSVLAKQPDNLKALYRRGSALIELEDYDQARLDLRKARELDPSNEAVKTKLKLLESKVKSLNSMYASNLSKMFQ